MEKFTRISSNVMPLPLKDVDTDLIYPAQYLTSVSRTGLGANLFAGLRSRDPQFPSNQPLYKTAQILVSDSNFGCGSSREHAVWALIDAGFRVIIAKSFADIFAGNSAKNGLLLVALNEAVVDNLLARAAAAAYTVCVDLEEQVVGLPDGGKHKFEYDPFRKHCLLNGLDDIDYIRSFQGEIGQFRQEREEHRYMSTLQSNR